MAKITIYTILVGLFVFIVAMALKGIPLIYNYKHKDTYKYNELCIIVDKFTTMFTKLGIYLVYDIFLIFIPFLVFYDYDLSITRLEAGTIILYFILSRMLYCFVYHYKCMAANELLIVKIEEMHQLQKKDENIVAETA